jgi:RNA polymerase sigma-70 factor (ECF subfamily)
MMGYVPHAPQAAAGKLLENLTDAEILCELWPSISVHHTGVREMPVVEGSSRLGESISDKELVKRVQDGDKRAFDILVRKYQFKIVKLISRYVQDPSEALDVTQEAFLKAYRALPGFRGDSAFYTWLYRIAINTAKNHLVALGRRPPISDIDSQDAEQFSGDSYLKEYATPEGLLLRDEIEATVFSAIDDLPEDLRTAITLRELEGLSYEEIAQAMGCPIGTVRSRIFRAREAIDGKLRPLLMK